MRATARLSAGTIHGILMNRILVGEIAPTISA